jgi:hypothetical protein
LDGISATATSTEPRNVSFLGNVSGSPRLVTGWTLMSNSPPAGLAKYPIDLPTFDDQGSTVHYDVQFIPEGFAGYRYWIAYTPFPNASREDPSIAASNDGISWTLPNNFTNPLYTKATAISEGWGWNADPDLVWRHDGKLACYFMSYVDAGSGNWGARLSYMDTTNGVTWSARQTLLTVTNTGETGLISPAVVREPDDSYVMWYASRPSSYDPTAVLKLRTSANGTTWGAAQDCTYFTFTNNSIVYPAPWHPNVARVDTNYFMLLMGKNAGATDNYQLYWGTSSNKTEWHFDRVTERLQTRTYYDTVGFYRGALLPRPGLPLKWDFWLPAISASFLETNNPADGVPGANEPARTIYLGDVEMPDRTAPKVQAVIPPASIAVGNTTNAWGLTNMWIGSRFTVTDDTWIRYACFTVLTNAGNLEVGIYRMYGAGHDAGAMWQRGTRFACPSAGAVRQDIGLRYLPAGDYVVYLWASHPDFATYVMQNWPLYRGKIAAGNQELTGDGSPSLNWSGLFPWSARVVGGFTLEGDY